MAVSLPQREDSADNPIYKGAVTGHAAANFCKLHDDSRLSAVKDMLGRFKLQEQGAGNRILRVLPNGVSTRGAPVLEKAQSTGGVCERRMVGAAGTIGSWALSLLTSQGAPLEERTVRSQRAMVGTPVAGLHACSPGNISFCQWCRPPHTPGQLNYVLQDSMYWVRDRLEDEQQQASEAYENAMSEDEKKEEDGEDAELEISTEEMVCACVPVRRCLRTVCVMIPPSPRQAYEAARSELEDFKKFEDKSHELFGYVWCRGPCGN